MLQDKIADKIAGKVAGRVAEKLEGSAASNPVPGSKSRKYVPQINSKLRHHILKVPDAARNASGILVNGRRIKSLVFTTDIAIIRNCNADAVLAVYPFTPQPTISSSVLRYSSLPVFCGVGGGTTQGIRTLQLAWDAETEGAMGVVVNAPIGNEDIERIANYIDIPLVVTVVNEQTDIAARLNAGASILNVSAAARTPEVVRAIRRDFPDVPIIATGGGTEESIMRTVEAGANAISYTPPTTKELFSGMMEDYRSR